MALTPHIEDENRKAELERRKEDPHTFNAGDPISKPAEPKQPEKK